MGGGGKNSPQERGSLQATEFFPFNSITGLIRVRFAIPILLLFPRVERLGKRGETHGLGLRRGHKETFTEVTEARMPRGANRVPVERYTPG